MSQNLSPVEQYERALLKHAEVLADLEALEERARAYVLERQETAKGRLEIVTVSYRKATTYPSVDGKALLEAAERDAALQALIAPYVKQKDRAASTSVRANVKKALEIARAFQE